MVMENPLWRPLTGEAETRKSKKFEMMSLSLSYLMKADKLSKAVMSDLVGTEELVVSIRCVDEEVFAPVGRPVRYRVASYTLTDPHEERTKRSAD